MLHKGSQGTSAKASHGDVPPLPEVSPRVQGMRPTRVGPGNTTDGYTSGAINSDEDPYNLGSISGTETANEADPPFTVGTAIGHSGALDQSGSHTPASGNGYSPTDYQPLSVLRHGRRSTDNQASPPRKRRGS